MPVEIREIIIRTEILSTGRHKTGRVDNKELKVWKKQLLEECRRMIAGNKKIIHNR